MSRIVTFAKRNKKEVKRFIKFMAVGAMGAEKALLAGVRQDRCDRRAAVAVGNTFTSLGRRERPTAYLA